MKTYPVIVLGSTGYVAGEMLRLIAGHPNLHLAAAVSMSQAGQPIASTFGHLRACFDNQTFVSVDVAEQVLLEHEHSILLSAAPHGASAALVARLLSIAKAAGNTLSVVDASADFRFRDAKQFEQVYRMPHPTPELLDDFVCAVPEHSVNRESSYTHAAHPGCFATSMLLGIVPLLGQSMVEPSICVSAVTGSTGAGRTPRATTHHPERQSNLFAYQVLKHRHAPEVEALSKAATGKSLRLHFVPHSGPFARGIHATIFAPMQGSYTRTQILDALKTFYENSPLVYVLDEPPKMKDIAGSSYAALSVDIDNDTVVVTSVIDNLLKGASGGSIQWLNRIIGVPETTGLLNPSLGWL